MAERGRAKFMHLKCFAVVLGVAVSAFADDPLPYPSTQSPEQAAYTSPYFFSEKLSHEGLIADFHVKPRDFSDWQNWSLTPYEDWDNFEAIQHLNSTWGPYYAPFKAPDGAKDRSVTWLQERVAAAASLLRNQVPYGHHHMNVWDVPDEEPWTGAGYEPGYGIDCSDFTHFAYNYGLGIQLKTGIKEQAALTSAPMHLYDGRVIEVEARHLFDVRDGPLSYNELVSQLQPGDLLYIRGDPGLDKPITHVIMWMGDLAYDSNGVDQYLIMDSHGDVVVDSNGNEIPSGPELRPFREDSYYFNSFDHVVRYFPLNPIPEPNLAIWGLVGVMGMAFLRRRKS